ncbi:MAG: LacI family DNA-binding transcriptional regulator, partial [Opitutaceae bacterium]
MRDVAFLVLEALQSQSKMTLRSLAELCGVSSATVSRALSGHPNVRPGLRERV